MPHIGNHLTGIYLLPCGDTDAGAMGVEGRQPAAVVDFDIVPVTATPAADFLCQYCQCQQVVVVVDGFVTPDRLP